MALSPLGTPSPSAVWTHVAGSGHHSVLLPTITACSHPRWLWPWWHATQQHLAHTPHPIGYARRHRGRARPPRRGRPCAMGGQGLRRRLAQGGV